MARPTKQGVDYFPLDVHLDDKFKFIEIKYKLEGFAIVVKIMQRIYSQGYWCKWSDDEALLFSDEIRADIKLVQNVVTECVDRNLFDKELYYKYGILTSKGIQKRYKEIVRRRTEVEMATEYILIDGTFGVIDDKNEVNDVNNPSDSSQSDGKSTQSKVNKTELNESNDYSNKPTKTKFIPPTIAEVSQYCRERKNKIDPNGFIDYYEAKGWIVGKTKMKDWKAAIRNWERNDRKNKKVSGDDYSDYV